MNIFSDIHTDINKININFLMSFNLQSMFNFLSGGKYFYFLKQTNNNNKKIFPD